MRNTIEIVEKEKRAILKKGNDELKIRKKELKEVLEALIYNNEEERIVGNPEIGMPNALFTKGGTDLDCKVIPEDITSEQNEWGASLRLKNTLDYSEIKINVEDIIKICDILLDENVEDELTDSLNKLCYHIDIERKDDYLRFENNFGVVKTVDEDDFREAFVEVLVEDKFIESIGNRNHENIILTQALQDTSEQSQTGCLWCSDIIKSGERVVFFCDKSVLTVCEECYEDFLCHYTDYVEGGIVARKL